MKKLINRLYVFASLILFKLTNKSLSKINIALINLYSVNNGFSLNFFNNLIKSKKNQDSFEFNL